MPDQRINGELEISLANKTMYIRGVWVKEESDRYHFYLNDFKPPTSISILGVPMHVIAVAVRESDRQLAVTPLNQIVLQDLGRISPHGTPFETCVIDGEECVLCMIPYTR